MKVKSESEVASYLGPNPVSLFTLKSGRWLAASCICQGPQQSPLGMAASTGLQFGEPSFAFGGKKSLMAGDISCLLIWQEIFSFHVILLSLFYR